MLTRPNAIDPFHIERAMSISGEQRKANGDGLTRKNAGPLCGPAPQTHATHAPRYWLQDSETIRTAVTFIARMLRCPPPVVSWPLVAVLPPVIVPPLVLPDVLAVVSPPRRPPPAIVPVTSILCPTWALRSTLDSGLSISEVGICPRWPPSALVPLVPLEVVLPDVVDVPDVVPVVPLGSPILMSVSM
jgi:hypothetical protein